MAFRRLHGGGAPAHVGVERHRPVVLQLGAGHLALHDAYGDQLRRQGRTGQHGGVEAEIDAGPGHAVGFGAIEMAVETTRRAVEMDVQMGATEDRIAPQPPAQLTQLASAGGGHAPCPAIPGATGDVLQHQAVRPRGDERGRDAGREKPVEQAGAQRQQHDREADPAEPLQTVTSPALT
ncbi:hypothetical protein KCV01_g16690, partial [Aureobasidium melanogenum]